ncbi:MAG: type IV pilus biogenesis/stability protein PilW [Rhodocyclales bacterium]|nr:type IV pilus biogenesis/stability protein PilW [Rhodocyclales bacterium]
MIASLARFSLALTAALALALPPAALAQQGGGNQDAVTKDPRSRAKVHTELGSLYFQDGNVPVAMEELTVAIYIDPTYAPAYSMRALVHHFLKEPNHAEDNFREALRYAPDDPEIANNYGWFLCQNSRGKEAMPHFERALRNRLYQTPDRAYLNAGQCAMNMGDLPLAADYLEKAYRMSGGSPVATLRLAELNYRTGRLDEARKQVSELVRKIEPNAEVLWLGARIERKVGDREAEIGYVTQLRRKFPASKEYQELLKGNYE